MGSFDRRLPPPLVVAVAALAVLPAWILVLAAPAAAGTDPSGRYVGTVTQSKGVSWESAAEVRCDGSTCEVTPPQTAPGEVVSVEVPVSGGSAVRSMGTDACGQRALDPATIEVSFAEDTITIEVVDPTVPDPNCSHIGSYLFTGSLMPGGLIPEPEPGPGPEPEPGSTVPEVDLSPIPTADVERVAKLTDRQLESIAAVQRGDRSVVPASLSTPSEAASGAGRTVVNLALAGLAVLLLLFPSQLFNATWTEHHERVEAWWRARLPGATDRARAERRNGVAPFAVTVVAGAVIGGFLDPAFGGNLPSLALVVGAVISIGVGALVAGRATLGYRSARGLPVDRRIEAIPSGLVIAVVCVVISRLVDFRPGYLFGLVGGLVFAAALDNRDEGRQELTATVVALAVALGAWVLAVPLGGLANEGDPNLFVQITDSALSALFIGGIEGLLIGLVPLQLLPGHALLQWRRSVWAAVTFLVCFVFLQVLLRPEAGYLGASTTASVTVTAVLFIGFGVAAVSFWGYFQLRPEPRSEPDLAQQPPPDRETIR